MRGRHRSRARLGGIRGESGRRLGAVLRLQVESLHSHGRAGLGQTRARPARRERKSKPCRARVQRRPVESTGGCPAARLRSSRTHFSPFDHTSSDGITRASAQGHKPAEPGRALDATGRDSRAALARCPLQPSQTTSAPTPCSPPRSLASPRRIVIT